MEKKEENLGPEEWHDGEFPGFSLWGFIFSRLGTVEACCVIFHIQYSIIYRERERERVDLEQCGRLGPESPCSQKSIYNF